MARPHAILSPTRLARSLPAIGRGGLTVYNRAAFAALPDLVVFDLDGTIYPYEPAHAAALNAAGAKARKLIGVERAKFIALYEAARRQTHERLHGTASSHNRLLYFSGLCEMLGIGTQPAIALDLEQTYWTTFFTRAEPFPEALDLLEDLRLAGITTALVTDLTAQIQYRKLIVLGLDRAFTAIVTSEEAGADKPDGAPFALLARKLGSIPTRVWAIGDDAAKDCGAPKREWGASTLLRCNRPPGQAPEGCDASFSDFAALRRLLAALVDDDAASRHRLR